MSDVATPVDHYRALHARTAARLPGTQPVAHEREAALHAFAEAGFPHTRMEDWKYTSLRPLERRRFETASRGADLPAEDIAAFLPEDIDAFRIVIVDGYFNASLSRLDELPAGVRIRSFADFLDNAPEARIQHADIDDDTGSLAQLNAAFVTDGAYIEMAANTVLEKPLHVLTVASGESDERMCQVRYRIVMHDNSQATVIEHYAGLGDKTYFTNAVTEALLGHNAQLTRCRVQQEGARGYHIAGFFAKQRRDSRIFNHGFDLGGRLARIDTNTRLCEDNAEIHMYGVYAPSGRQHIDNHTRIDHATEHGISREVYKGVLSDYGRGVFNGKVIVHPHAQKTDSDQSCDALLLSDNAEVDAKPELEIYADDVTCGHGSTVGQLDENAVFYLKSRGVDEAGARAILTYSFANELVQKVGIAPIQRYVEAALLAKLPGGRGYADLA